MCPGRLALGGAWLAFTWTGALFEPENLSGLRS